MAAVHLQLVIIETCLTPAIGAWTTTSDSPLGRVQRALVEKVKCHGCVGRNSNPFPNRKIVTTLPLDTGLPYVEWAPVSNTTG